MKRILGSIWPILLVDAGLYLIQELMNPVVTSKGLANALFEIVGFGLVAVVAFIAARSTHRLSTGILATLVFWLIWRPLLFVAVGLPIAILLRDLSMDQALKATLGLGIALVLFSPIALALGFIGGLFGRRGARP